MFRSLHADDRYRGDKIITQIYVTWEVLGILLTTVSVFGFWFLVFGFFFVFGFRLVAKGDER